MLFFNSSSGKPRTFTKFLLDNGLKPTVYILWVISLPLYLYPAYKEYSSSWKLFPYGEYLYQAIEFDYLNISNYKERK